MSRRRRRRYRVKSKLRLAVSLICLVLCAVGIFILLKNGTAAALSYMNKTPDKEGGPTPVQGTVEPNATLGAEPVSGEIPPTTGSKDVNITIAAAGDIMFHDKQLGGGYDEATGTYNFNKYFDGVKDIISSADLAIANFETTTCGNDLYKYQGYPVFNSPDEVIDAIKYAGFDVLSTVNNHCLDTGKTGMLRTLEKINAKGLSTVGTYAQKPDTRVLMKDVQGVKIGILAYTELLNSYGGMTAEELNAMVNTFDKAKMKEDIQYAKDNGADLVILIAHWGVEYAHSTSSSQQDLADYAFKEGVDIILGSHPHVIQESKNLKYDGRDVFVVYSMGNFISNQRYEELQNEYTEDGVIITFDIKKSAETGKTTIESVNYTPTWVYREKEANKEKYDYRIYPIMKYIESEDVPQDAKTRMQRSYKDTMSKMDTSRSKE